MFHGTTILAVRHGGKIVVAGDGQVSLGDTALKHTARKVRKLYGDRVIAGFAGATADAFTLFEKFEGKLEQHGGGVQARGGGAGQGVAHGPDAAPVGGADDRRRRRGRRSWCRATATWWRPTTASSRSVPGGNYALAAARALVEHSTLDARAIAEEAMKVAATICVYTNGNLTIEELP